MPSTFDNAISSPAQAPIKVCEVDLSQPLEPIDSIRPGGSPYTSALICVRLHGEPLGIVSLSLAQRIDSEQLKHTIHQNLGEKVDAHLRLHNETLPSNPTTARAQSRCEADRLAFLETAPHLTVVIPTRDRPERLRDCVISISECSYPRDRLTIIVVDNVPKDDHTRAVVDELKANLDIRYLVETAPGSASARNRAISEIETDIVAFTDDDAVLDRWWLCEVARGFSSSDVDAVSGLLLPLDLETQSQVWFEEYGGFSRGFDSRTFDLTENIPENVPLYPFAAGIFGTGNNMAFRTTVLRSIGGFDPALGNGTPALGGVDSEVLLRTVLLGFRIRYCPSALVYHSHRKEYDDLRRQVYAYGAGLTAYLLKTITTQPACIPRVLKILPRGVWYALSPRSEINSGKGSSYPRELTRTERRGMLLGLVAYPKSRHRYGRHVIRPAVGDLSDGWAASDAKS